MNEKMLIKLVGRLNDELLQVKVESAEKDVRIAELEQEVLEAKASEVKDEGGEE